VSFLSILAEALFGKKGRALLPSEVALASALTAGLYEISAAMSTGTGDVQGSLDLIASATASVLRVERCVVLLKTPGEDLLSVRAIAGMPRGHQFEKYRQEIHDSVFAQVLSSGEGMVISESQVGGDRKLLRLLRRLDIKGFIAAPIRGPKEVAGVLAAASPLDGRYPSDTDLKLLSVMANFAGVALENAQLVARLDRKALKLQALFSMSKALNEESDPAVLFQRMVDCATELMGASSGSMILVDGESGSLRIVAEQGLGGAVKEQVRLRLGEGITGWVAREGETLLVPDVRQDPRYVEANPSVRAEMAVPIKWGNEVVGVLNLDHHVVDRFSVEDLELLEAFANVAAVALRNADVLGRCPRCPEPGLEDGKAGPS
jgi:sigma-B regulation protein RsbU (phosphoserine phosphatase)